MQSSLCQVVSLHKELSNHRLGNILHVYIAYIWIEIHHWLWIIIISFTLKRDKTCFNHNTLICFQNLFVHMICLSLNLPHWTNVSSDYYERLIAQTNYTLSCIPHHEVAMIEQVKIKANEFSFLDFHHL
jgi:hypothetical protein